MPDATVVSTQPACTEVSKSSCEHPRRNLSRTQHVHITLASEPRAVLVVGKHKVNRSAKKKNDESVETRQRPKR